MVDQSTERDVMSGDVRIAVREFGDPALPHVVLIHGYPDDQTLWDGVVRRLAGVHAITYDVRGAGRSDVPRHTRDYRQARLTDDLVAVVEATVPEGEPFLLVGHDWGSIQCWDSLTDPRLADRILAFVSASGPSLDHIGASFRGIPPKRLASQLVHSTYVAVFQVPKVPELLWSRQHPLTGAMVKILAGQEGAAEWSPELAHNAANGVQLYRANMLPKLLRPRPRTIDVPIVLVVATEDTLVGPAYVRVVEQHCTDVRRVEVQAAHWHPRSRPEFLAGVIGYEVSAARRS